MLNQESKQVTRIFCKKEKVTTDLMGRKHTLKVKRIPKELQDKKIYSTKDVLKMLGLVHITPKAERIMKSKGFSKMKEDTFPFRVIYIK